MSRTDIQKLILEEFGNCLLKVIHAANSRSGKKFFNHSWVNVNTRSEYILTSGVSCTKGEWRYQTDSEFLFLRKNASKRSKTSYTVSKILLLKTIET